MMVIYVLLKFNQYYYFSNFGYRNGWMGLCRFKVFCLRLYICKSGLIFKYGVYDMFEINR